MQGVLPAETWSGVEVHSVRCVLLLRHNQRLRRVLTQLYTNLQLDTTDFVPAIFIENHIRVLLERPI